MGILNFLTRNPARMATLQKVAMIKGGSFVRPVYLINEHPKSGATWFKFMLSDALGLPPWTKGDLQYGSCVAQDCFLEPKGRCRMITLFRDGRDVMVSYYYHSLFRNEFQNDAHTRRMRDRLGFEDYDDIRQNLLPFMQLVMDHPVNHGFNWVDFVRAWGPQTDVPRVHYEDLRRDAASELIRLVDELKGETLLPDEAAAIVERYSMANMRKRKSDMKSKMSSGKPVESSFIRKGSVGGWTEHFTDEALAWFEERAGPELEMIGYRLGRPTPSS